MGKYNNTQFDTEKRGYQPTKSPNVGYRPQKPNTTTPPNKGSNVQPPKTNK